VAFVGFLSTAVATRMGPVEALNKFLSDPATYNIT